MSAARWTQSWQNARLALLAIAFGGVVLTLGKTLTLSKTTPTRTVPTIDFPQTVPLPGWQALDSKTLPNAGATTPNTTPHRQYRYVKNGVPITITMRYFGISNGDVKPLIQTFTPLLKSEASLNLKVRENANTGYYGVFVEHQQAHLSSCINGRGDSTFTILQFQRNRNVADILSERFPLWLLGFAELRDRRCLWVHLETPVQNAAPDQAYQALEQAWIEWYRWWQPRFQKT